MSRPGDGRRVSGGQTVLMAGLLLAAFVAPGAWFVTHIPPAPAAKLLMLVTAGLWFGSGALGIYSFRRIDRRVRFALAALLVAVAASFVAGGWLYEVAFFDLFADMPLVAWLAFPAVFALASGMHVRADAVRMSAATVVVVGVLLALVMAFQFLTTGTSHVFGSSAYSVTALVPVVPLAVGLGLDAHGPRRVAWLTGAGLVLVSLGAFSGALTGTVAAAFSGVVSTAILGVALGGTRGRVMRTIGVVLAALAVAGMLFVQVPALSSRWVNPQSMGAFGKNVVSRTYMWSGAQEMLLARPLLGFGPSGYRLHAAEYLAPEALQFGPDIAGNADPTVYSPQSPHSILWEIATRLGVVGLLAFAGLLATWLSAVIGLVASKDMATLRTALAAGFLAAIFATLVNPVLFPIGLLSTAIAGLSIAPVASETTREPAPAARSRALYAVLGVAVIVAAVWLYAGEWRTYTADSNNASVLIDTYESALRITPGQPTATRLLLDAELFSATDDASMRAIQARIDAGPDYMLKFAPNAVDLVAYSLMQAERTGRTDVSWEQATLDRAASVLPPIPSLVAEQLHIALITGDERAVGAALPAVRQWGRLYPYSDTYIRRAEELLGIVN
ncbi:MAG: O-antigen ligase family protein [Actinobacteria bacterium]|nr:MAG: O-antigen ligase family protein [Actinomycetota bacterium]